jgi:hypothetical protein
MAQQKTVNPYSIIGTQVMAALDAIIAALPPSPTVDDLITQVYNYVKPIYYPTATQQITIELKSVAYNVINSYQNNLVLSGNAMFNGKQAPFLQMLIGQGAVLTTPDSFADRLADIEDNIGISDLTINDQTPLFLATTTGNGAYNYWIAQIDAGSPTWGAYLSQNPGQNYMNVLQWSLAAMNGALAGYGATPSGMIQPTTEMVTTKMVSALIGAITATAGRIIFNWTPRITKPFQLQSSVVASLRNNIDRIRNNHTQAIETTTGFFCTEPECGQSAPPPPPDGTKDTKCLFLSLTLTWQCPL